MWHSLRDSISSAFPLVLSWIFWTWIGWPSLPSNHGLPDAQARTPRTHCLVPLMESPSCPHPAATCVAWCGFLRYTASTWACGLISASTCICRLHTLACRLVASTGIRWWKSASFHTHCARRTHQRKINEREGKLIYYQSQSCVPWLFIRPPTLLLLETRALGSAILLLG